MFPPSPESSISCYLGLLNFKSNCTFLKEKFLIDWKVALCNLFISRLKANVLVKVVPAATLKVKLLSMDQRG